jgi:Domain of unknown function (DUF6457)
MCQRARSGRATRVALPFVPVAAMTGEMWLRALATEFGVPVPTEQETTDLLALASTAAHASERLAAPLSCWLAARAGITAAEALAVATRLAEKTEERD